jgi:hypothetical protein
VCNKYQTLRNKKYLQNVGWETGCAREGNAVIKEEKALCSTLPTIPDCKTQFIDK